MARRKHKRTRPSSRSNSRKAKRFFKRHVIPCISAFALWAFILALTSLASSVQASFRSWTARRSCWFTPASSTGQSVTRLVRPLLPVSVSRIAPFRLDLDPHAWSELPERQVIQFMLDGLHSWVATLHIPPERVTQWHRWLHGAKPSDARLQCRQDVLDALLHAAACVGCLLESKASAWEHVQSLNVLHRALSEWIFPASLRSKRSTSLSLDVLWLSLGSLKLTLINDWQTRGGARKFKRAQLRSLGLPPAVFQAFFDPLGWTPVCRDAVVHFLSLQIHAALCKHPGFAVLYLLSTPYLNYLGSTRYDVTLHQCQGGSPVSRSYQHVLEHKCSTTSHPHRSSVNKKCRHFCHLHPSDHMFWVLTTGPETYVRSLEDAGIACWCPNSNSRGVGAKRLRRCRHSRASRRRCRHRPKAHTMPVVHAHVAHHNQWLATGSKYSAARDSSEQLKPLRDLLASIRKVGFGKSYQIAQKYMLLAGQGFGPVHIMHADFALLLVRYVADAKPPAWDSLCESFGARCNGDANACAIHIASVVRSSEHCAMQLRAKTCISAHLVSLGLRPLRRIPVAWPRSMPMRLFHDVMRDLKNRSKLSRLSAGSWFASLVQPVRPKAFTFAHQWKFISAAKRFGNLQLLRCPLAHLRPTASDCACMRRAKLHWRVPMPLEPQLDCSACLSTASWLARQMGCAFPHWLKPVLAHKHGEIMCETRPEAHWAYASCLPTCPDSHIHVQEDKDRNACWIMPIYVYEKWCFWLFRQDILHWVPVELAIADVVEHYRLLHEQLLPLHLKHFAKPMRWRSFTLPYAYCTLKAKCFSDDGRHICPKESHSCFRRIISWCMHPARHVYRNAGRAMMGIIIALREGFETLTLTSAVPDFRRACAKLRMDSTRCACVKCGGGLQGLSLSVCDAAQMYEELPPDKIRSSLSFLIQRLRFRYPHASGIAVTRSKRLHTWVAKGDFRHRGRCQVWTWDDMQAVLDLALQQPIVRLGKALFKQVTGAPIGGHLSKAIASIVLAADEIQFCEKPPVAMQNLLPDPSWSCLELIAPCRYVDDLALGSHLLCHRCLHRVTHMIYTPPVSFDPASAEEFGFPWLDVWLFSNGSALGVRADAAESAWKASGGAASPKKFRIKPWLGDSAASDAELRALAASKLTRLRSLALPPAQLQNAISSEINIWALSGYPAHTIKKAWTTLPHFPDGSKCANNVITAWIKHSSFPARVAASWESSPLHR